MRPRIGWRAAEAAVRPWPAETSAGSHEAEYAVGMGMARPWAVAFVPLIMVACASFDSSSQDGGVARDAAPDVTSDAPLAVPDGTVGRDASDRDVLDAGPRDAALGPKRVFVTAQAYAANLGFDGFDTACAAEGSALGGGVRWMAYVSGEDAARAAIARLRSKTLSEGPWYTIADLPEPVATLTDLASGSIRNPIRGTPRGTPLDVNVWTGAPGAPGSACANWTTTGGTGTVGSSTHADGRWAAETVSVRLCTSSQHLYCFEL